MPCDTSSFFSLLQHKFTRTNYIFMTTKARVHEVLVANQAAIINELHELVKSYQLAIDIDEEDTKDMDDLARQDSESDLLHTIELQLIQAKNDMAKLEILMPIQTETVTLGSLVITENYKFYVSISNHSFNVDGEEYIGLTTDSPLYIFIKGKKEGESFSFNKMTYVIKKLL